MKLYTVVFLLLCNSLFAQTTYYVSPVGSDSNPGTIDQPFATPAKPETVTQNCSATTVYFREGVWYETAVALTASGCPGNVIVWQSYPGESATLSGGMQVLNWINVAGNLWQATLAANAVNFEALYYNGVRRFRPRLGATAAASGLGQQYRISSPIAGYYDRFYYNPADPISTSWTNYSPSPNNPCGQAPGPTSTQGDVTVLDFELWDLSWQRISCIDTVAHIVYLTGSTTSGYSHGYLVNHRYVVENVASELTQPGQWFLDRSQSPWVLNYLANVGEDPNVDTVVVPQQSQVMTGKGIQYRTFSGITFAHDNYVVPKTGYKGSQAETMTPAAVPCTDCSNITFDGDTFTQTTGYGLAMLTDTKGTATGNIIQNNYLYDLGAGGITVGNMAVASNSDANVFQFGTIQNNLIQGYGRMHAGSAGLTVLSGHDLAITQNDVNDGYSLGILVCIPNYTRKCAGSTSSNGTFNVAVSYNHIWQLGQGLLNDFGCVYFATYAALGNSVLGNRCHDLSDASTQDADGYGANGIYIDRGGPIAISNNLVYRTENALSMTIPQPTITANNNIFAYSRRKMIGTFTCATASQFVLTNNILLFDRTNKSKPAGFYVQAGVTYTGAGLWQVYAGNDYWNTSETFSTDPKAFSSQSAGCKSRTYYTLAGWQGLGEDAGSVSVSPGFTNATYPADDYSFANGNSPIPGFVPFCLVGPGTACPGRLSGNAVAAVLGTFQTLPFNPATDY